MFDFVMDNYDCMVVAQGKPLSKAGWYLLRDAIDWLLGDEVSVSYGAIEFAQKIKHLSNQQLLNLKSVGMYAYAHFLNSQKI